MQKESTLAVALLALLTIPALAQNPLGLDAEGRMTVTGSDARLIAQIAQRVGDTDFTEDVIRTPHIVVHRDNGDVWFEGQFIGCSGGVECQALALVADFGALGLTGDQLNSFNNEYYYVRAYANDQRAVIVQQDVMLTDGVNDVWLERAIRTFGHMADIFAQWSAETGG